MVGPPGEYKTMTLMRVVHNKKSSRLKVELYDKKKTLTGKRRGNEDLAVFCSGFSSSIW
jgi:hypothetical protein